MLLRVVLLSAFATLAWAQDSRKSSQDSYFPDRRYYSGLGTYAAAGSGFYPMFGPFMNPYPLWPFVPFPQINPPLPWYKGPNVCVETKYMEEPEELKEFLKDVRDTKGSHEQLSESCRGTDSSYVCYGRKMNDGKSKFYVTKYQCCHGFVPAPFGQAGCVESKPGRDDEEPSPGRRVEFDDSSQYDVVYSKADS